MGSRESKERLEKLLGKTFEEIDKEEEEERKKPIRPNFSAEFWEALTSDDHDDSPPRETVSRELFHRATDLIESFLSTYHKCEVCGETVGVLFLEEKVKKNSWPDRIFGKTVIPKRIRVCEYMECHPEGYDITGKHPQTDLIIEAKKFLGKK